MTRYRPLIMLAVGITFIYWIISLHKAPFPYPRNIILTRDVIFGHSFELYKPDGIFICAQNDWVYLTAIWKGYGSDFDDATGLIKQYRRPLHLLLSSNNFGPDNEWKLLYVHRLDGPIAHTSSYHHKNNLITTDYDYDENNALAVLYQKQEEEQIQYVLRLYNIGNFESGSADSDYVDIIMPGTTKIKSFHVEDSLILYSRNPDNAKFRTIQIPRNIFEIGKRKNEALIIKSGITREEPSKRKTLTYRRVYAASGVIRVMNAEITADEESWTFQVTVIHNSSSVEDTSWRNKKLISYTQSSPKRIEYDQFDFVRGITPISPTIIPKPIVVTARNMTTICIALNDILFTFDYSNTTSASDPKQDSYSKEAYIVRSEYLPVLEELPFQVIGAEVNANGNILLLVTQENYILIYKRGLADIHLTSSTRSRKGWFDRLIDDNQINNSNRATNINGENWELRMVITSSYLDFVSQSDLGVIAVKTLNISRLQPEYVGKNVTENILLTLFENGRVATFNLDRAEQEMKLWFIIKRRWQMNDMCSVGFCLE
ncbi:1048_t:CDS:10 [Scutellospora calospora]|uniref:1048_t:CDS:1 n=1 Tax=Scutellospora calospora TaxID=85575 RepID=A0ACA9KNL0_9GLOM|nr:1048_t:CDS:10 [Scutellospora calospora]